MQMAVPKTKPRCSKCRISVRVISSLAHVLFVIAMHISFDINMSIISLIEKCHLLRLSGGFIASIACRIIVLSQMRRWLFSELQKSRGREQDRDKECMHAPPITLSCFLSAEISAALTQFRLQTYLSRLTSRQIHKHSLAYLALQASTG